MRWKRALIAVALGIPAIGLLGFGLTRDPRSIPSPLPGRAAPPFSLAVFTGGTPGDTVRLAELRGDVVVVNFWASWCLACASEHAALSEVGSSYRGTDVHFFGVLYNDAAANGVRWLERSGEVVYPALLDPGARTAIDYGLYGVPETFFIGRDGRVAYKHTGPVTAELLRDKIEELRRAPRPVASAGGTAR